MRSRNRRNPMIKLTVRVDRQLVAELDRMVQGWREADPATELTRSDALRAILAQRHQASPQT